MVPFLARRSKTPTSMSTHATSNSLYIHAGPRLDDQQSMSEVCLTQQRGSSHSTRSMPPGKAMLKFYWHAAWLGKQAAKQTDDHFSASLQQGYGTLRTYRHRGRNSSNFRLVVFLLGQSGVVMVTYLGFSGRGTTRLPARSHSVRSAPANAALAGQVALFAQHSSQHEMGDP